MKKFVILCFLLSYSRSALSFSKLCSNNISRQNDVDCSRAVEPNATKTNLCTVRYYSTNSSSCSSLKFTPSQGKKRMFLGDVDINPYIWYFSSNYKFTLFNISFTNIQWTNMKFRFEALKDNDTSHYKNHCREIILSEYNPTLSLNYDCHWSEQDRRYENETYIYEYLAENSTHQHYGKYIFIVPPAENQPMFAYVDITNPRNIHLKMNPSVNIVQQKFHIETCTSSEKNLMSPHCENSTFTKKSKEVTLSPIISGWYFFKVTSDCNEYNCVSLTTPKIFIDCNNIIYTILWNVLWILLALKLFLLLAWMLKRWRRRFTPNVLMLYSHVDSYHASLLHMLRKYMQTELNWNIMWDQEIELTNHGDPYLWCLDAFMKADCVIYIIKPTSCCIVREISANSNSNIHINLEEIFLKVLKTATKKKKTNIFNVGIDFYGKNDLPSEIKSCRTFFLLREWNSLFHSILKHNWFDMFIRGMPSMDRSIVGRNVIEAYNNHEYTM